MERPCKRSKPNDYHESHNSHTNIGHEPDVHVQSSQGESRRIIQHSGEGVQNVNGTFHNGRDFNMQHNHYYLSPTCNDRASTNVNPTISKEQRRSDLLESLSFAQIDARRTNIKTKSAKTCRCFLKLQQYVDWLDLGKLSNHGGLLWIKGKPGAGKSTLMKFAFSDALRKSKRKGAIVISFFFNARGEELERSTAGLYRSLLVQLFEALPDLQHVLDTVRVGHQWSVESLKSLLEDTVKAMGNTSVVCFIDALDECDEKQIRDMLSFIRSTSDQAATAGTRLHVCFASRHYPHITIGKGLDLVIEGREEHQHSIANYLDTELHIGHDQFAEQIRSNLQEKASGVFMWVVLVVDILNKEYDRGCKHGLKKRLKSIPSDLHELFQNILSRDTSNTRGLLLCIQWVLFARRPLKPEELYFAIMSGVEPESLPDCHSKGHITDDVMRRYILDNSKGLAESTNSNIPTIQFIHESVRDFLLKDNGLRRIWPNLESNLEGQSHENLRQCCLTYMTNKIVVNHDLSSLPPGAPQSQAKDRRQAIAQRFPFLEYANQNLLYHADKAEGNGVSQKDFISKFPLCDWIVWSNLFEKHQIRRYTKTASLLYILAERNMPNLIRILDSAQSCFTVEDDRYGTPIFAALATQSNEAIHTLIDMQASSKTRGFAIQDLHERFSDRKGDTSPYNRTFTFSRRNAILEHIIEKEDEATLAFYLSTKEGSLEDFQSLLSAAAGTDNRGIIQLLLNYNANIHENLAILIYPAFRNGWVSMVKELLDYGADIETISCGQTRVGRAVRDNNKVMVQRLLEHNTNTEATSYGETPLIIAVKENKEAIVQLLLAKGANVDTYQDSRGLSPLFIAASDGHEGITRAFLNSGANIEFRDFHGRTPLMAAALHGRVEIVKALLHFRADSQARDNKSNTALSLAVRWNREDVASLLVSHGGNFDSGHFSYEDALLKAVRDGHVTIATLLLDRGVNIEAPDSMGYTALSLAVTYGSEILIRSLLDRGADIKACNYSGRTPLHQAALLGHEDIVRLLLNHGANIEAVDRAGNTPLVLARENKRELVVKLLLNHGASGQTRD